MNRLMRPTHRAELCDDAHHDGCRNHEQQASASVFGPAISAMSGGRLCSQSLGQRQKVSTAKTEKGRQMTRPCRKDVESPIMPMSTTWDKREPDRDQPISKLVGRTRQTLRLKTAWPVTNSSSAARLRCPPPPAEAKLSHLGASRNRLSGASTVRTPLRRSLHAPQCAGSDHARKGTDGRPVAHEAPSRRRVPA